MSLNPVDRDALSSCLAIMEAHPEFVEQQRGRPWRERAESASYRLQIKSLRLRPWESPPSVVDENDDDDPGAQELLRQMLKAGISRYDPDPLEALKKKSRRK